MQDWVIEQEPVLECKLLQLLKISLEFHSALDHGEVDERVDLLACGLQVENSFEPDLAVTVRKHHRLSQCHSKVVGHHHLWGLQTWDDLAATKIDSTRSANNVRSIQSPHKVT